MWPVQGPHTQTTRAQKKSATWPGQPPQGRAAGRGRAPDARRPSQRQEVCAPGATSCHPRGARQPQGTHARRPVLGLHTSIICAQRTSAKGLG